MDYAEDYYDADGDGLIAISVVATEHAVATSNILGIELRLNEGQLPPKEYLKYYDIAKAKGWSNRELAELLFILDLITRLHPTGIVSYVADSFDFWFVVTEILPLIREVIVARESKGLEPGKLVIRPDSGDPVKVVTGVRTYMGFYDTLEELMPYYLDGRVEAVEYNGEIIELTKPALMPLEFGNVLSAAEVKGAVQLLWETFGGTETSTGHKLLDSHIGLIYGDSITTKRSVEILQRLVNKGFASGNVVFGVGSYTYQCNTRDTFGFAVKATHTIVDGTAIDIFKDPKTDSKKKSAKGLLFVGYNSDGGYVLEDQVSHEEEASDDNKLKTFYLNGRFTRRTTLDEIRARLS